MANESKKLRLATIVYWILLLYVIAALVWWAFLLLEQTEAIYHLKKENLSLTHSPSTPTYNNNTELLKIEDQRKREIYKYVGEGTTFLLLIMVGAVFIYRYVRRQFLLHRQQQNFVMAVTHELKTPIAVSKINLETLQKYQLEEEKKNKLLQATLQETVRLDSLINNILISSQLEENSYRVQRQEIDFSNLVQDVLQQFQTRYPNHVVQPDIEKEIAVNGDPLLLKLLLSNLLENAIKYTPADKSLLLSLRSGPGAELRLADQGSGIPDEEKKNVFKKFYRIGSEATRKAKGTGLGLYICKRIAEDHNGSIHVKDNQPEGSIFIVELPPL
jgi:two-component system, OmpR family, sensor histidine kinase CiaH